MLKSRTYIATPPGETIREQLNDREMTQKEFAARMEMSEKHISKLINGDVLLTPETAFRLEMVLGIPASFWLNLEGIYRDKLEKARAENEMDDDIAASKNYPYNEMSKNGWVPQTRDPQQRVFNLRKHFEVARLGILDRSFFPGIACRRLGDSSKSECALLAWAQEAKLIARGMTVGDINIERLKAIVPTIRHMTTEAPEQFCGPLIDILADCGIALVFLPHIGGSYLHGATFRDGKKIVVALTVRGKDADRFWFSLFHELGHIIFGHGFGVDGTSDEDEKEADNFARSTLIPDDAFAAFIRQGKPDKAGILAFAASVGIDPGIVVGRLQNERVILHSCCNELKTKYAISA